MAASRSSPSATTRSRPLIEYFAEPNPSTVLVVTSCGLNGKSKLVNAAKKSKGVVEHQFAPPSEADAARGLQAEAKRLGLGSVRRLRARWSTRSGPRCRS